MKAPKLRESKEHTNSVQHPSGSLNILVNIPVNVPVNIHSFERLVFSYDKSLIRLLPYLNSEFASLIYSGMAKHPR